ncbi:receptor-interacting serine/threonine-protein kinase 3-like [Centropristis striata]|uniref:receptor-interacting serine/threonine-protein kinase 3-like n=1 Tax=Centropristis striata TaxID=184440 RepID=UPI0027DF7902|nr:receptor-interacting serine/threonine-protein kinase 3-like [Centropristis striata]
MMDPILDAGFNKTDEWKPLGSGGFSIVYKARRKGMGDVAIKIFRGGVSPFSPQEEARLMSKAFSTHVVPCYGMYHGCPPGKNVMQDGIVLEFMKRGSVENLLDLSGRPPWPLVFRWAYQVAQGLEFLHFNELIHQDLKPSNVLLDGDFNAKLADFGLTRVSASVAKSNTDTMEWSVGTYQYKPPEAFEENYEPVRAFDIYSYGILLWSIVTGKKPYGEASRQRVKLLVCEENERPPCKEIEMNVDGLEELIKLMKRCWKRSIDERPKSEECRENTEKLYKYKYKYEEQVHEVVAQVVKKLDSKNSLQDSEMSVAHSVPLQTTEQEKSNDIVDFGKLDKPEKSSRQDSVSGSDEGMSNKDQQVPKATKDVLSKHKKQVHEAVSQVSTKQDPVSGSDEGMSDEDKANFVDKNRTKLIRGVSEAMAITDELKERDMVHPEAYSRIKCKVTSYDKMRELYDSPLHSGGVVVKAAFYDALKRNHPTLV